MSITNDMIQATPGMILPIDIENIFEIDWKAIKDCRYIYNYDIDGKELKELLKNSAYTFLNTANLKLELCLNNLQFEDHTVANSMRIGLYEPQFVRTALDDSIYSILRGIFNDYYDFRRKFIGHRAIILDQHRFTLLKHNYDLVKDAMVTYPHNFHWQSHTLTLHKVFKAYVASFDCHLLGNGTFRDWSFIDVVKKICVNNATASANGSTVGISPVGGPKFNSLIKDINLEEYKIISQILDNTDQDYYKFVKKMNEDLSNALMNYEAQVTINSMLINDDLSNALKIQQAQAAKNNLLIQQAQIVRDNLLLQQSQATNNFLEIQQSQLTNNHLEIQQSQAINNSLETQQSQDRYL